MPIDLLVLSAALLTGLLGSAHCGAMCGGIAVGLASDRPVPGQKQPLADAAYRVMASNLGRIGGYALAGALVGGLGAGMLGALDLEALAPWIRSLLGLVLLFAALQLAAPGWAARLPKGPSVPLWQAMAPLRAAIPRDGPWRPWILGLFWGWLPCGLSFTLLTAAWLEGSALHGALLMTAFGIGTLPTLGALGLAGARLGDRWSQRPARYAAAALIGGAGLLTLGAPWLMHLPLVHGTLQALGCRSVIG